MSQTKFDNILRSALWTSYMNKCFYCNKTLEWDDLHIDHIIPEKYSDDLEKLKGIIFDFELDEKFDLNAPYNLVPTHRKCNLRKGDELFIKRTTLYYLGLTKKKLQHIEQEIQKLQRRKNKGQIISKLQSALATDLIGINDLESILTKAKKDNWSSLKIVLPHGIEFMDEVYDHFYLNTDCSVLYDKKLLFGGVYDSIELSNDEGEIKNISTLREWREMTKKGFYPLTNFDIKMSSNFTFLDEFLKALHEAKMPRISFISEPWLDIDNLNFLSPTILHDVEGRIKKIAKKGFSIGDLVRDGIIKRNESRNFKVSLEFEGMETSYIEQFRADFNNDGIEDIFVRGWTRAIGGTLGCGFTTILTRLSDKHLIEEIK